MTLAQAYGRASKRLRRKMEYSISLLRKAEKLALAYDTRGGVLQRTLTTSNPVVRYWERLEADMLGKRSTTTGTFNTQTRTTGKRVFRLLIA